MLTEYSDHLVSVQSMNLVQESVLNPNPVKSLSISRECRMVCSHSKTAVRLCLSLCIADFKSRDSTWYVGFTECVGSVHRKLWRSLTENVKLAGMDINIGCISDRSRHTHYLFRCYGNCVRAGTRERYLKMQRLALKREVLS